ncbi:single-stranded DNA-binding protein [Bacillus clarus]|uniref:Single-stranded DNA-binding protein n=1 Tax=Bacillus clarus TaxID=2338372 RepID=A0A090Z214_9BACI|nr:single-stranded DNA-binding protein [Bacillus clarus]KFN04657.1 single-stranded DNA-binding protein ssb [Bacillus clarus]RFT63882.1 single-stranded DNA-binding protein [Bacillus clarus]
MSLNRTILVGRLTKDPDLRYTPNGVAVATFTLAVNRVFGEGADFLNIVVWRKQAENAANYLKKGSLAGVDGRLQTRNYEGQDGKRVYVTEVVAESVQFLEPRNSGGGERDSFNQQPVGAGFGNQGSNSFNQSSNSGFKKNDDPFSNSGQPIDISDDDLPF